MNLFINLENKKYIELALFDDNGKVIEKGKHENFTTLVSQIYDITRNNDVQGYIVVKFDKNITVKLNGKFEFKKDKEMLLKDIRKVKKS